MTAARELWQRLESIHAVTYFAPESISGAKEAGLKGFWMGYFGFRAAPMGAVEVGPVHAAFANFARPMVERSLPDAWAHAAPADLIEARAAVAAAALRRLSPALQETDLDAINHELGGLAATADTLGRSLFAANVGLAARADPIEQLWQHCTTLREHRGDGHVIALASHNVDGCEAHHLSAAANNTPHGVLQDNRGFNDTEWQAAADRLEQRGLLVDRSLTAAGSELVRSVEALTDELDAQPTDPTLLKRLTPIAKDIAASGVLPFPNPMGLPKL